MDTQEQITSAVSDGVREGITSLLKDEEIVSKFWSVGYDQLTKQAAKNTSQWVGKRVLTMVVTALFVWTLTWLVRNGGR